MSASAAEPGSLPRAPGSGYRVWLLVLLMLVYTSNFVDRSILGVLAPAIKRELHLSDTQIGMLGGLAFAVFYTVLGVPLARLAERRSRVLLMTACIAVWSAMTAVCGLAQSFVQLALARTGVGVGEAGCLPAAQSLISDHFPPSRRATALAVFSLGIPLGSLIGAVAGGWIAQHLSWRQAFFLVGLPGLVLAVLTPLTLREPARGQSDAGGAQPDKAPPLSAVIATLWRKPGVLWVCAGASVSASGTYGVGTFLASYFVRRFHLDLTHAGLMAGLVSGLPMLLSNMLGGVAADRLARSDRRGYAWTAAAGLVLAAPLFIAGFLQTSVVAAAVLLGVGGVFQQVYLAPTFAVANNAVSARMRASSVALLALVWNLVGLGFGPVIVGAVSDAMGRSLGAGGTDPLGLCLGAGGACANAPAAGLIYGLLVISLGYAAGAALFLVSARTLRRDLA